MLERGLGRITFFVLSCSSNAMLSHANTCPPLCIATTAIVGHVLHHANYYFFSSLSFVVSIITTSMVTIKDINPLLAIIFFLLPHARK